MDDALDGVYRCDADGVPAFFEADATNYGELHAAVRVDAHDRKQVEQLCRHITRPAPSVS